MKRHPVIPHYHRLLGPFHACLEIRSVGDVIIQEFLRGVVSLEAFSASSKLDLPAKHHSLLACTQQYFW